MLLLLGLAAVVTFLWLLQFRSRLRMKWYAALCLSILHVIYGVFCVKAFAVLEGNPISNGAMSLFGAVFFMPLAYWLGAKLTRRSVAEVFDIFAPCMIFTLLCARVNCLFAGCCLGRLIPGMEPWRFPTRELEIIFYIVFLTIVVPHILRGKTYGQVYPLYMFSYGIVRGILEFFRVASTDHLFHLSHIWALIAFSLGLGLYAEIKRRHARHGSRSRV
ncbi:MAG: prolipoprotein diacylglyceryl transferase [Bacteroidales bacterium]|nr:prolipoprotein diacylglyceryl transferase [Bacteroidales bacterium]